MADRSKDNIIRNSAGKVIASRSKVTGKLIYWMESANGTQGIYQEDTHCGHYPVGLSDSRARELRIQFERENEGREEKQISKASILEEAGESVNSTHITTELPNVSDVPRETESEIVSRGTVLTSQEKLNQLLEDYSIVEQLKEQILKETNELMEEVKDELGPETMFTLACYSVTGLNQTAIRAMKYALEVERYNPMVALLSPLVEDYVDDTMVEGAALTIGYDGTIHESRKGSGDHFIKSRYLVKIIEIEDGKITKDQMIPIKGLLDQVIRHKGALSAIFSVVIPSRDAIKNGMMEFETPSGRYMLPVDKYKELNPEHNLDEPMKDAILVPVVPFDHLDEAIDFLFQMLPSDWTEQRDKMLKNIGVFIHDVKEVRAVTPAEAKDANPFVFMNDITAV